MSGAVIDIDGTLLTGPRSSEALFIRHLVRNGRLGPRQIGAALRFMLVEGPRHGRHVFRRNKAYLAGLRLADIAEAAEAFVASELQPLVDQTLLARIDRHRAAGEPVLLLSGTPAFIAAPLARLVKADGWRAARYAVRDGLFLASAAVEHPLGSDKLRHAERLCEGAGLSLGMVTAYADSRFDLPLLHAAGRAVVVRPDRQLRREAIARGWEILDDAQGMVGRAIRGHPGNYAGDRAKL